MKKAFCIIAILVLSAILAISTYMFTTEYIQDQEQMKEFESIAIAIETSENNSTGKYTELYEQNKDFIGWIKIDDTEIDYPVMQSIDNPNYYLTHNFNKEYSRFGVPYIQESCTLFSDNIIIYGHNMKNSSMFNGLTKYESKDFYNSHKYILFDTLDEEMTYEIIAVFKTVAYTEKGFKYYAFVEANSENDFIDYIEQCKSLSLYDINETAEYGDKLITLSTCEYSRNNGRMVIVAKKI